MSSSNEDLVGALIRISDGREFALGFGNCRVGRKKGSDLWFSDRTVSRHHADITYESGRYVLYDNSTNGTWINGNMVAAAQSLRDGDVVKLGALEFRFRWVPRSDTGDVSLGDTRVSGASTLRIKGGKAGGPSGVLVRALKVLLLLVLLAVVAAAVVYFVFPEVAEPWVERLRGLLGGGAAAAGFCGTIEGDRGGKHGGRK